MQPDFAPRGPRGASPPPGAGGASEFTAQAGPVIVIAVVIPVALAILRRAMELLLQVRGASLLLKAIETDIGQRDREQFVLQPTACVHHCEIGFARRRAGEQAINLADLIAVAPDQIPSARVYIALRYLKTLKVFQPLQIVRNHGSSRLGLAGHRRSRSLERLRWRALAFSACQPFDFDIGAAHRVSNRFGMVHDLLTDDHFLDDVRLLSDHSLFGHFGEVDLAAFPEHTHVLFARHTVDAAVFDFDSLLAQINLLFDRAFGDAVVNAHTATLDHALADPKLLFDHRKRHLALGAHLAFALRAWQAGGPRFVRAHDLHRSFSPIRTRNGGHHRSATAYFAYVILGFITRQVRVRDSVSEFRFAARQTNVSTIKTGLDQLLRDRLRTRPIIK